MGETKNAALGNSAPTRAESISELGMNPLLLSFIQFVAVCLLPLGLVYLLASAGGEGKGPGGAIVLIGIVPWSLGSFWFGIKFLGLLVTWGGPYYRRTRNAILTGQIGLTYCLRGAGGANFLVVDEPRKLVAVNGQVIAFKDIREVSWEVEGSSKQMKFTLNSGKNPIVAIHMSDTDSLKTGYARVCNSMGIS